MQWALGLATKQEHTIYYHLNLDFMQKQNHIFKTVLLQNVFTSFFSALPFSQFVAYHLFHMHQTPNHTPIQTKNKSSNVENEGGFSCTPKHFFCTSKYFFISNFAQVKS